MSDNPLVLLPAKARQTIYVSYGVLALVVACVSVGFGAAKVADPIALTVTVAVIQYLAVPVTALAALNVNRGAIPPDTPRRAEEQEPPDWS